MELAKESFSHAISGGGAASLALMLFYPLDIARTHIQLDRGSAKHVTVFQVLNAIRKKHGWTALYDGVGPNLVTQFVSQFVYFYVYNAIKIGYLRVFRLTEIPTWPNIFVAASAGVVNVMATAPLWVASTRMKMQRSSKKNDRPYRNVIDAIIRIGQEEGIGELWSGTIASIVLVSNPIINFVTYDQTKYAALRLQAFSKLLGDGPDLPGYVYFCIASWSKLVTTLSTYPLQVVQNRLRNFKTKKSSTDKQSLIDDTIECLREMISEGGTGSLYKGLTSKLLQTVLTAAFMFLWYEKLMQLAKANPNSR